MATKLELLKDLREHPNTSGGETAARLDVSEGAVLEAYRRSRRQGLIEGDGLRPEKFKLTEAGMLQLRVLSGEEKPQPGIPTSGEAKVSELEERMNDAAEDVRGLFRIVDSVLRSKRTSAPEPDAPEPDVPSVPWDNPKVQQLYALQLGMSDLPRRIVRGRKDSLAAIVGSETADLVAQLVSREEKLSETGGFLWGGRKEADRLQKEITELRNKLGFVALDVSSEEEEAGERRAWW